MYTITRRSEHLPPGERTALVEGEPYGAGVSFFWTDAAPGEGPPRHHHPYAETWVVLAGTASATADEETFDFAAGDIVTVLPGTVHRFEATGTDRLHMLCIHPSPRVVEEEVDG
ncbi:cupin domain-containing protein [Georgenia sp. TF02-10]|uniref:cupin domain-containing protein n=1 Tax=Georgenia sp. TF02-10 TaxID=2917725 RepID=UPI001FA6C9ED|nr:cupin domain-containing protein [Georgenia sp. TF02-10]UNX54770.1 cupin domain-containing protein [Georgenia sp. TF02-10]